MRDDFAVAVRRITRDKASSLLIVVLLALAVAINASVMAVAYTMLWKPLPYRSHDRLVQLTGYAVRMGMDLGWSVPYFDLVARDSSTLETLSAYRRKKLALTDAAGTPTGVADALFAQPQLLPLLGAPVQLGRPIVAEDAKPGAEPVVLLGHEIWQSRFGGAPHAVGQDIYLSGRRHRIIGVLSRGFVFPDPAVQLWVPLGFSDGELAVENAGSFGNLRAVARLRGGATPASASEEMDGLVRANEALWPIAEQVGLRLEAQPIRNLWLDGRKNSLITMLVAALLVLTVTVGNAYTLFVLRMVKRRQELALLEAVGATAARRGVQVSIEAACLVLVAIVIAIACLPLGFEILRQLDVLPTDLPQPIRLDAATGLAIAAVWFATTAVLGSSSLVFHKQNVFEVLRQTGNGQTGSVRTQMVRRVLVVGQLAITFVLLFATLLLIRSSNRLLNEDIGFDRAGRVIGTLQPATPGEPQDEAKVRSQMAAWLATVAAAPGVEAAAFSSSVPFSENVTLEGLRVPDGTAPRSENDKANVAYVSPGYLQAVGLELVSGRPFSAADADGGAAVAVIDEHLASRYFGSTDVIGRTIEITGGDDGASTALTVVGVVRTIRQRTLAADDEYPALYRPLAVPYAVPGVPLEAVEFILKTSDPDGVERTLDQQRAHAPGLRVAQVTTMERRIDDTVADLLRLSAMLQMLSGVTLLLTAVGLYALLAHSVAMRSREFAVRRALGATRKKVLLYVLVDGTKLVAVSVALGLPVALLVGSLLKPRLHEAPSLDGWAVLMVMGLLALVGLAANIAPAWRASRVSAMLALRAE